MKETGQLDNKDAVRASRSLNCYARVSVLFARSDSIYKTLGCDVWDEERNALNFKGGSPVVAHPPCRLWSQMRQFSTAPESEKYLAIWAVEQVRKNGGVLEHPASSGLWKAANLPEPGKRDSFGGFTLVISQWWFGHKADKLTRLYICGVEPKNLPPIPFRLGEPEFTCSQSRNRLTKRNRKPEITKAERQHTPLNLALWLIETALKTRRA
jgi:hypothetical protein